MSKWPESASLVLLRSSMRQPGPRAARLHTTQGASWCRKCLARLERRRLKPRAGTEGDVCSWSWTGTRQTGGDGVPGAQTHPESPDPVAALLDPARGLPGKRSDPSGSGVYHAGGRKVAGGRPRAAACLGAPDLAARREITEPVACGSHVRAVIRSAFPLGLPWRTAVCTEPSAPWHCRARMLRGGCRICL